MESHDARNFNYWPAGKAQGFDGLREPEVVAGDPDVARPRQPFREAPAGERVDSRLRRRQP